MAKKYYLPSKIHLYFRRLLAEYREAKEIKLLELISHAKVHVNEAVVYSDWNGESYGHDIKLFLPESIISKIPVKSQSKITNRLLEDLSECHGKIEGEFLHQIIFELADEDDPEFQRAVFLVNKPVIDPSNLSIWNAGCIRLFISHRDNFKREAKQLAEELAEYGISSFVAHDNIEPMKKWQNEILDALDSMEIMLAFVTDDFHGSEWTNQEVGYALARNTPIISFKLQSASPKGFIADTQAVMGSLTDIKSSTAVLYELLADGLGNRDRMQAALVQAFCDSPDWRQTTIRFNRLMKFVMHLTDEELNKIIQAYALNDQLNTATYLINEHARLEKFLKKVTGQNFVMGANSIMLESDVDIPF